MEKIGNMQTIDNKGDKFFCLPMISMPCTGSRYARHPGVGHKKKANRTNSTGRNQYGHIQGKEIQTEKWQRKRYKKNNGIAKEQTQEIGERRQAARKTRSKPQPNKPVKGRRTLY